MMLCREYTGQYPITQHRRTLACKRLYEKLGHATTKTTITGSFSTSTIGIRCVNFVVPTSIDIMEKYMAENKCTRGIIYYIDSVSSKINKELFTNIEIARLSDLVNLVKKTKAAKIHIAN